MRRLPGIRKISWPALVVVVFILLGQQWGLFDQASQTIVDVQPGVCRVTKCDDGDTVAVDMNGVNETIRFIGVDTPETHDPRKAVQCFGIAAANFTKNLIGNNSVRLEAD